MESRITYVQGCGEAIATVRFGQMIVDIPMCLAHLDQLLDDCDEADVEPTRLTWIGERP